MHVSCCGVVLCVCVILYGFIWLVYVCFVVLCLFDVMCWVCNCIIRVDVMCCLFGVLIVFVIVLLM